jgi:hypothetical protein
MQEVAAGLRQELGQDELALTLEELGLAPAASLTVQVGAMIGIRRHSRSCRRTTPSFESKYANICHICFYI